MSAIATMDLEGADDDPERNPGATRLHAGDALRFSVVDGYVVLTPRTAFGLRILQDFSEIR